MNGCLQGVVPRDRMHTLWASSWAGARAMPLLWAQDPHSLMWARVGAVNRCGAYCSVWGCGDGQTQHYSQADCDPNA